MGELRGVLVVAGHRRGLAGGHPGHVQPLLDLLPAQPGGDVVQLLGLHLAPGLQQCGYQDVKVRRQESPG